MNEVLMFSLILVGGVFISACSQILLKKSANIHYESKYAEYLNKRVIGAYFIFGIAAITNMLSLRFIPLTLVPILETTGFIFVAVLSFAFLKEKLSIRQVIGFLLIIIGIVVYY